MDARKLKYPKMYAFDEVVMESVKKTRQVSKSRTPNGYTAGIGFYRSVTNTIYSFLESDAMGFQLDRGILTTFTPTTTKNYPSQGLGGEITQVQSGRVFRMLLKHGLTDSIKLFNNVHDALYIDFESKELADQYMPLIIALLEDVAPYFQVYYGITWDAEFPVEGMYGLNLYEANNVVHERDSSWCLKI